MQLNNKQAGIDLYIFNNNFHTYIFRKLIKTNWLYPERWYASKHLLFWFAIGLQFWNPPGYIILISIIFFSKPDAKIWLFL